MKNNNCKIVTWNVNSIRSRLEHLLGFLRSHSPDVVLLQELKLEESKFPYMEIEELGYNCAVMGCGNFKQIPAGGRAHAFI
jgi:exodeoxyribonuclease-3